MCIVVYLFIAKIIYSFWVGELKGWGSKSDFPCSFPSYILWPVLTKKKKSNFYFDKDCDIKHSMKPIQQFKESFSLSYMEDLLWAVAILISQHHILYLFIIFLLTECTNYCPNKKHKGYNVNKLMIFETAAIMKIMESSLCCLCFMLSSNDNRMNVYIKKILY